MSERCAVKKKGFTVIEAMVASAILAIGALGVLGMLVTSISYNRETHERMAALTLAEQQLSEVEAYAEVWTASLVPKRIKDIQDLPGGSWSNRQKFNINGLTSVSGKTPVLNYFIAYQRLGETPEFPSTSYVRGQIRVVWPKKNNVDCDVDFSKFDDIKKRMSADIIDCDFVSLPFAFRRIES